MEQLLSNVTPVRSNLAQMLLTLKDMPSDAVSESLNRLVSSLSSTPSVNPVTPSAGIDSNVAASQPQTDEMYLQNREDKNDCEREEEDDEEDDDDEDDEDNENSLIVCNCKKSKCLKLYCQCFAVKAYCNDSCNCVTCRNTVSFHSVRSEAMHIILERNPNAFDSKVKEIATTTTMIGVHRNGCRCRKSKCLKKYCECFQSSVTCSLSCICISCCNTVSSHKSNSLAIKTPIPALLQTPQGESEAAILRAAEDLAFLRGDDDAEEEAKTNSEINERRPSSDESIKSESVPKAVSSSSKPPLHPQMMEFKWASTKRKRKSESPEGTSPQTLTKKLATPFIQPRAQDSSPAPISTPIYMSQDDYNRFKSLSDIDIVSEIIRSSPELLQASILSMGNTITSQFKTALNQAAPVPPFHDTRSASPNSFNCAAALSLLCGANASLFGTSPIASNMNAMSSPTVNSMMMSNLTTSNIFSSDILKTSPLSRERSISESSCSQNMDVTSDEDHSSGSPHSISTSSSREAVEVGETAGVF